jgi:probable rRNA maturation factor
MSLSASTVIFRKTSRQVSRRDVRTYAALLARDIGHGRPFCCLVAGDDELRRLNRNFLGKDYPTDVLSFPSGATEGQLGDIAISLDRAKEQATEAGHSTTDELKILMLHGVLHLVGMDHERDRGTMRRAESHWRRKLLLPPGLIERQTR